MTTPLDQTERAAFEAWHAVEFYALPPDWNDPARAYFVPGVLRRWDSWQQARAPHLAQLAASAAKDARIADLEAALSIGFSHMMLAPIDGTPVLLYMPTTDEKFAVGQWHGSPDSIIGNWGDDEGNYYVHQPVGWIRIGALEKLAIASKLPSAQPIAAKAAKEMPQ